MQSGRRGGNAYSSGLADKTLQSLSRLNSCRCYYGTNTYEPRFIIKMHHRKGAAFICICFWPMFLSLLTLNKNLSGFEEPGLMNTLSLLQGNVQLYISIHEELSRTPRPFSRHFIPVCVEKLFRRPAHGLACLLTSDAAHYSRYNTRLCPSTHHYQLQPLDGIAV